MKVGDVMQRHVVGVQASSTLRAFADSVAAHHRYAVFPVYDGARTVGTVPVWALSKVPVESWEQTRVGDIADSQVSRITPDTDLDEALRQLARENAPQILLVTAATESRDGALEGIVTKTDILRSLGNGGNGGNGGAHAGRSRPGAFN
jgi:predicted transcriptional regulator